MSSLLIATRGLVGSTATRTLTMVSFGFLTSGSDTLPITRKIGVTGSLQEDLGLTGLVPTPTNLRGANSGTISFSGAVPVATDLSGSNLGTIGIQGRLVVCGTIRAKVPTTQQ